jgi:hypothetical protein
MDGMTPLPLARRTVLVCGGGTVGVEVDVAGRWGRTNEGRKERGMWCSGGRRVLRCMLSGRRALLE